MSSVTSRENGFDEELWIGEIRVQPKLNQLSRGDTELRVEPKVIEILSALAARPGSPLSREELLAGVWGDVHVSDDALHRAIWKLRRALDEVAGGSVLLETIPKRGYRLVVQVEAPAREGEPAAPGGMPPSPRRGRSGVVLGVAAAMAVAVGAMLSLPGLRTPRSPPEDSFPAPSPSARFEPLTALRGYESEPSLSPDGSRVVFHHYHKGGDRNGRTDLYLAAISGGEPQRIDTGDADSMRPAWSPIDDRIAYVNRMPEGCRLRILTLGGGEVMDVGDCGMEVDPGRFWFPTLAWSSDARELFVSLRRRGGEPARIYAFDLAGRGERVVSDPPLQALGDEHPKPSPDGGWIAFHRRRADDVEDLYLVSLRDGREQRLTHDHQPLSGVAWSADSRELWFSSARAGTYRLWRIPVNGGTPNPVDTVGMNATSPSLSPAGDVLVYEEWKSEINIWVAEEAGRRPLVASSFWEWRPQLSPDGRQIAFLSNREGSTEVWVGEADGTTVRRLTDFGLHFATVPRWSPDGTSLVFSAPQSGNFDVWSVDLATGEVRRLTRDASQERAPTWSADGGTIYFASNRAGAFDIWSMPFAGGTPERVTSGGGRLLLESPGGRRYLVKGGQPGIWELGDDGERLAVADFPASHWMNVDMGGEDLYFARFLPDWTVNLERLGTGGELEVVGRIDGPEPEDGEWFNASGLSVSAGGSTVLWASVDRSDSDLWLARY